MALAATVTRVWHDGQQMHVLGTVAASGSYATGGDTLDLAVRGLPARNASRWVELQGESGFAYRWVPGSGISNGKVKVYGQEPTSATAGVIALSELAAGAYPTGITGDAIRFHAIFDFGT